MLRRRCQLRCLPHTRLHITNVVQRYPSDAHATALFDSAGKQKLPTCEFEHQQQVVIVSVSASTQYHQYTRTQVHKQHLYTVALHCSVQIYLAWTPPSVGNPPITDKRSYLAGIRTHHYYNATPHQKLSRGFYIKEFGLKKEKISSTSNQ